VILHGGDAASGLADMLHQFLVQVVAADPARARRAARMRGALLFRAAEDPEIRVRIAFTGDGIEVADAPVGAGDGTPPPTGGLPEITADFITIAHLTTGEEGPFQLLLARRLRVRMPWRRGPFLVRALRLMRLPPATPRRRRWPLLAAAVLAIALIAVAAWLLLARGG